MPDGSARVPGREESDRPPPQDLWCVEIAFGLFVGERRRRATVDIAQCDNDVTLLEDLLCDGILAGQRIIEAGK